HLQTELLPLSLASNRLEHRRVGFLKNIHARGTPCAVKALFLSFYQFSYSISTPAARSLFASVPSGRYMTPFQPNFSAASTLVGKSSMNTHPPGSAWACRWMWMQNAGSGFRARASNDVPRWSK